MRSVFISYSRNDRDDARVFAELLDDLGFDAWWDFEIIGGVEFREEIDSKLKSSDIVLVLWSPNSIESNWVIEEAQEGLSAGKLLPIIIRETEAPRGFREIQSLDFTSWDGDVDSEEIQVLLESLDEISGSKVQISPDVSKSYGSKRASIRNVVVALVAAILFLGYSVWDYLDPESTTQPRARLAICAGLLALSAVAWFVRTSRGASIVAAVIAIFSAVSATLLMSTYDNSTLGLLSPSAPLNICLVLLMIAVYAPIRLFELVCTCFVSIAFYAWAAFVYGDAAMLEVAATVFNLVIFGVVLTGLKVSGIHKFGI